MALEKATLDAIRRARTWIQSDEGKAKLREIREHSSEVSRRLAAARHVHWEDLQRPMTR